MQSKLSHSQRQIQALAAQIKESGGTPTFVKNLKGNSKGKKGRSRSPGGSSKDSDASSVASKNSTKKGAGNKSCKPKAKAKGKASSSSPRDEPKKARGNAGSTPPQSPRQSVASDSNRSSSNGSSGSGNEKIDRVCHFHKPWRKPEQGGPKKCTNTDCRYIHAGSEKAYREKLAAQPKKKASRGQVARVPGLLLSAALLAAIPGQTESTATTDARFPWYADSGHEAGLEVLGIRSHSRPSWVDEMQTLLPTIRNGKCDWDRM